MDPATVISALVAVIGVLWAIVVALAKKLYDAVVQENKDLKAERATTWAAMAENSKQNLATLITFYQAWREQNVTPPGPRQRGGG